MKIKHVLLCLAAMCILTGCGKNKSTDTSDGDTETTLTTTAVTTTAVTTTAPVTTVKVQPPENVVMKCRESVEVYEEIRLSDFITETNMELSDGSVLLNTSDTGDYEVEIPYMYEGHEFRHKLQYSVVDTTPPLVLNSGWATNHKCGTDFDLNDYVGFADNYDKAPSLSFTGEVDPDTVGAYPITATAEDSSGNSVSWDLTIYVMNEVPPPEDNNPRVDYGDFIARYDNENVRFGIDVSAWQKDIDFNAVRDAGCSFVIIRIGYYYSDIKMDDYFRANLENATAAGLDVGIYYYTTDRTEEGVKEHAKWIAEQLDGHKLDFPVAFDWEEFGSFQKYGMSIRDLNDLYAIFADEMESYGYSAMLYSSKNFLNNFWSENTKASRPVWLAHFVSETDYTGEYAIWQASAYGRIPGIVGDVDMDIQYLDMPID